MGVRTALVEGVGQGQGAADGQRHGEHDERAAGVAHHDDHGLGQMRHQADAGGQHQRRDDVGQTADDADVLERLVLPQRGGFEHVEQAAQQDALDDPVGGPGAEQQQAQADQGVQFGMLLQPVQGCGVVVFHAPLAGGEKVSCLPYQTRRRGLRAAAGWSASRGKARANAGQPRRYPRSSLSRRACALGLGRVSRAHRLSVQQPPHLQLPLPSGQRASVCVANRSGGHAVEVAASHFKLPFGISLSACAQV
ncbi:hypothetical protein D9M69_446410 [compost metagenome]